MPTMSDKLFEDDKVKLMLRRAESEPVPFAFAPGDSPIDHALVLNPTKQPKALLAEIGKVRPESGRGTYGMARVEGKVLILDCEKKLTGVGKAVRKMLQARKFKQNKVTILIGGQPDAAEAEEEESSESSAEESASTSVPPTAPPTPPTDAPPGAGAVSTKALATAALAWEKAVTMAEQAIEKLRRDILGKYKSQPSAREVAQASKGLDDALAEVRDSAVLQLLRDALEAPTPENFANLRKETASLRRRLNKNGILAMIDDNPFTPVKARATLVATLDAIDSRLSK
jgi:hypothetical protein